MVMENPVTEKKGPFKFKKTLSIILLVFFWFPLFQFKKTINNFSNPNQISVPDSPYLQNTQGASITYPELNFLWKFKAIEQFQIQPIIIGILLLAISIILLTKIKTKYNLLHISKIAENRILVLLIASLFSFLHTGLLSPYTTNYFYSRATDLDNRWYTVFLLGGNQGAVNADYFVFRNLDYIYWGSLYDGPEVDGQLIRRSIFNFILSTPNFFINSYYIWIFINVFLLCATMICLQKTLTKLLHPTVATLTSLLFGSSLPIMLYFGSPWTYFAGVCCSVLLTVYFIEVTILRKGSTKKQYIFFCICASATSLTYDLMPIFLGMLIFSLTVVRNKYLNIGLLVALVIPTTYFKIFRILGGSSSNNNSQYIEQSLKEIFKIISNHEYGKLFSEILSGVSNFPTMLQQVIGLPLIYLAMIGIFLVSEKNLRILTLCIVSSTLLTYLFFTVSKSELSSYPRIYFHPLGIIIMIAGFCLNYLFVDIRKTSFRKFKLGGTIIAAALMTWAILIGNVDLIGRPDYIMGIQFGSKDLTGIDWIKSDLSWNGILVSKK